MYEYKAIVRSIYDADTIRVDIDLGFDIWAKNQSIRFYGINAPELQGETLTEARKSRSWLINRIPIGSEITLITHKDKKEKYGRYLATVYINGSNINDELVENGLAVPYIL